MAQSYSFGKSAKHPGRVRTMKVLFRGGVNPASGALAAGTRIRIRHSGSRGVLKVNL
jgi:hypothetical protein